VYTLPFLITLLYGRSPNTNLYIMNAKKMVLFLNHLDITEDKYITQDEETALNEDVEEAVLDGNLVDMIELNTIKFVVLK